MNSLKITGVFLFLLCFYTSWADEGMWRVSTIDDPLMQKMRKTGTGLDLNAGQIYNEKDPSIKDAILLFDNVGSAEFISANGLVLTNHHCGRNRVQEVSDDTHNYLRDGFWAKSQEEEIPIKGMIIKTLVRQIDVTAEAKELLKDKGLRKVSFILEKKYTDPKEGEEASLDPYSTGEYVLSVYRVFNDIRLVGVPPESIGNFCGEADNFIWPRQTGDFSLFRVYADANNQPAKYSKDNKPYHPKKYLPISLAGIQDNDFAMILGFPYKTQRRISSYELQEELDIKNRATILTKGRYIEVLEKEMNKNESIRLKYSEKNFNAGNSYSFAAGTVKQVNLSPALKNKLEEEAAFQEWILADSIRTKKYGNCLEDLRKNYELSHDALYANALISGALFGDASLWGIRTRSIVDKLDKTNKGDLSEAIKSCNWWYDKFIKEYDAATDKAIVCAMIKLLKKELKKEYLPDFYTIIDTKYQGDIDKYVDDLYAKSIFTKPDGMKKYLRKPNLRIKKDPLYQFGLSVYDKMMAVRKMSSDYEDAFRKARNLYREGFREMNAGKLDYPDANFSMRLTYGTVTGASPRDGLCYKSKSTLLGVIEKEDTTKYYFRVSPKLKELYEQKDFGRYGENGIMYVDFLTSNDITGGNSGSPVLNGKGEIIGIAFDGNWESLASDMIYEINKNRTINVDIRYVLFIIDKFAHSSYILNDLKIE